jgi:LDH2 family malate/lactate/ureidoglycolate dehydrogenase
MVVNPVRAVLLTKGDDVAALLSPVAPQAQIIVTLAASGETVSYLAARQPIPFGHKIAIRDVARGATINRYGHPIGIATAEIKQGEHVHAHNMRSMLSPPPVAAAASRPLRSAAWLASVVEKTLRAAGACAEGAEVMAAAITGAHLRGVETHGLRRLRPYVTRIRAGAVDGMAQPAIERRGSVLMVDGRNGVGYYVAAVAADAASKAARESGIAIALVRNSNHFGFAGYFATLIAARGQIGIVTSNGQVCVGPEGATKPLFSNDPIAIATPTGHEDAFLELDLATSVTSRANVVAAAKSHSLLPEGWAQDAQGKPTRDATAALAGSLLAFGGGKGFGLLVALEAITGVLAGGAYADQVSDKEAAPGSPEGTGHTLIAIDLGKTVGKAEYVRRLEDMFARLHALPVGPGAEPPRYPGERRWQLERDRRANGIPLAPGDLADLLALANEFGVAME